MSLDFIYLYLMPGNLLDDAELLSIIWEIFNMFPSVFAQKTWFIRLSHTSLIHAILLHCGFEEDKHAYVIRLLSSLKVSIWLNFI